MIRFLLNDTEQQVDELPADTTVLEYLRDHLGRCGTKEGCASGDCGACTVVLASLDEDRLIYEPLNACIATLGRLQGRQLITVEDLADGDRLHPVQQAMVDCHGSQCGFCTPGFVMSLFALYKRSPATALAREQINAALGGNLCRCTGYRPIVDAAYAAAAPPVPDHFDRRAPQTRAALLAIADADREATLLRDGDGCYLQPGDAAEVARLIAEYPRARLVAGGTDLLLELTQGLTPLPELIDLSAAADLRRITRNADGFWLGATATHSDLQREMLAEYPEIGELIERFGSLQIRRHGTLGGNIANASPIGDWPPLLLALGARLVLRGHDDVRELPLESFFLRYRETALRDGEFIEAVRLPGRPQDLFLRAWKISKRYEDDISSVCAIFALRLRDTMIVEARVACGGMAAVPARAQRCERALTGRSLDDPTALAAATEAIAGDFTPISDARASAAYRRDVLGNLLQRLFLEATGHAATRAHPVHEGVPVHG